MERDPTLRSSTALLNRIDKLTSELLKRYLAIIDHAKPAEAPSTDAAASSDRQTQHLDRSMTAVNTFRMEVETAALIRTAQSLLTLTRSMKELWLFGQLDTLGKSEVVEQTEKDALAVTGMVESLLKHQDAKAGQVPPTEDAEQMDVGA